MTQVRKLNQYCGPETVYNRRYFCGACAQELEKSYSFSSTPDDLEAKNNAGYFGYSRPDNGPLIYYSFCPWCGARFDDEWWLDQPTENERAIDHYQNPGHHKGDQHEFRGADQSCISGHILGSTDRSGEVCWCGPDVEPGLLGCTIRHTDASFEAVMLQREAERALVPDDTWDETMTSDEFEAAWADRSGVAVDQLHAWGRFAEPCDCGDDTCEGWAMGHQWEDALFEDATKPQVSDWPSAPLS